MIEMRRIISAAVICLLSFVIMCTGKFDSRAYETITVSIPVSCAEYISDDSDKYCIVIVPEDERSPMPASDVIEIGNNDIGAFSIDLSDPGTFVYRIYQKKGELGDVDYDNTVYIVTVFVENSENDSLKWGIFTSVEGRDNKSELIGFKNKSLDSGKNATATTTFTTTTYMITTEVTETTTAIATNAEDTTNAGKSADRKISDFIDTVLTGDSFPAHTVRITMLGAFLTATVSYLCKRRRDEEDDSDD